MIYIVSKCFFIPSLIISSDEADPFISLKFSSTVKTEITDNYEINDAIKHNKNNGINNSNRVRNSAKKIMSKNDLIRLNKSRNSSKSEMNDKYIIEL